MTGAPAGLERLGLEAEEKDGMARPHSFRAVECAQAPDQAPVQTSLDPCMEKMAKHRKQNQNQNRRIHHGQAAYPHLLPRCHSEFAPRGRRPDA